jgi:hypothetical protein
MENIFWNPDTFFAEYLTWSRANKSRRLIYFGRCRSGRHWFWAASSKLKELNEAKRAARPASKARGSGAVEYLYGYSYGGEDSDGHPVRFQITKKTAKRIYYLRAGEYLSDDGIPLEWNGYRPEGIGYVDRQLLEEKGEVYNRGQHWCHADYHLYVSFERSIEWRRQHQQDSKPESLQKLKMEMAAAHPDKGGTKEAFIEARKRYVAARQRAAATAAS